MANQSNKKQNLSGYLFAIGSTIIWSGNFIIARGLNEIVPPVSLAFFRWLVAVVFFLPFAIKPLIADWAIIRKNFPYLCATAFLGVTLFNTLVYLAGHSTTAFNLSLISITFPVFVVILAAIFLKEKFTLLKGLGILLVIIGVILLITRGNVLSVFSISFAVGDLLMLLAALTFAVYSLLSKRKPENLNFWAFQLSTFIIGLIFLTPFFIWEIITSAPIKFELTSILSILYIGIFASIIAFVLWSKAIAEIGPSRAGMMYYTMPIFSGLSATFLLGEKLGIIHLLSIAIILSGIMVANHGSGKS